MIDVDTFLERAQALTGHRARRNGAGYLTYCTAHEADGQRHRASLSVSGTGDELLLCCFAGCAFDAILDPVRSHLDTVQHRPGEELPARDDALLWEPMAHRAWADDCVTTLVERGTAPGVGIARTYLRGRGVTSDDCRRLGIGFYSPGQGVEPPPALTGEAKHDLDRLRFQIVYSTGATSTEGRLVPDLKPHAHPFVRRHELDKYAAGPKRWWGVRDVTGDEVAVVEGWADRVALERVGVQAVAARGQSTKVEDVRALAARGVTVAYLLLDANASLDRLKTMAGELARAGIAPKAMLGHRPDVHPGDDLGDLCTLDEDTLYDLVYGMGQYRNLGVLCDAEVSA